MELPIEEKTRSNLDLKTFLYEIHKIVKFHDWKIHNQRKVQNELRRRYHQGQKIADCISYILLNR